MHAWIGKLTVSAPSIHPQCVQSDPLDVSVKPAYDQQGLMRRYDIVSTVCDYMLQLGWEPYQNDHEDANGQFEVWASAQQCHSRLPHTHASIH